MTKMTQLTASRVTLLLEKNIFNKTQPIIKLCLVGKTLLAPLRNRRKKDKWTYRDKDRHKQRQA